MRTGSGIVDCDGRELQDGDTFLFDTGSIPAPPGKTVHTCHLVADRYGLRVMIDGYGFWGYTTRLRPYDPKRIRIIESSEFGVQSSDKGTHR